MIKYYIMAKGSKSKFLLGVLLVVVLKVAYSLIRATVKALAHIIVFFGLYIPLFYSVYGVGMILWGGLNLDVVCLESTLWYIGLGLSFACSIIITIRSRIAEPVSEVFASFREETFPSYQEEKERWLKKHGYDPSARRVQEEASAETSPLSGEEYLSYPASSTDYVRSEYSTTYGGYEGEIEEEEKPIRPPYYSATDPDILIYDYKHHTDYYKFDDDGVPRFALRKNKN